jgi:hypothetical protein
LQTAGISLLTPRVTVFGPWGNAIVTAADSDPQQGGLVVHLTNVLPFHTYYVEVQAGQANVFGIGAYSLNVEETAFLNNFVGQTSATVTQEVSAVTTGLLNTAHANVSFGTATPLAQYYDTANGSYYDSTRGSLDSSSDAAYYSVQAPPTTNAASGTALTAMVWGLQNQINPRVRVFDSQRNPLAAQVIVNDGYSYSIQIANAAAGATYYVEVVQGPSNPHAGNYFLGVDFSPNALAVTNQVAGSLTNAQPIALKTLDTSAGDRTDLFHFVLAATANGSTTVRMTLTDALGEVVFALTAGTAEAVSGNVLLAPGVYYATFTASVANGPIPTLQFLLLGDILTSPIGPESTDTSGAPGGSSNPGNSPSPNWDDGSSSGVTPADPASDPYTSPTAPVVTLKNPTDQSNLAGDGVQLPMSANDSAGNPLTFAATGLPPGLSIDANSGVISGVIANNAASSQPYVVTVTATDMVANCGATQSFYWYVNPPVISAANPGNQSNTVGDTVSLPIFASCSDGASLTYNVANLPPGLTIDPNTGVISGVIGDGAASTDPYNVMIDIFDPSSGVDVTVSFFWTVT